MCVTSPCARFADGRRIRARCASGAAAGYAIVDSKKRCAAIGRSGAGAGNPDLPAMVPREPDSGRAGRASPPFHGVWDRDSVRYIVIGAGAVGGSIGAALFLAGHDVLLAARGAHREAIATDGLLFSPPRGTSRLQLPIVAGPEDVRLTPDDVLIL